MERKCVLCKGEQNSPIFHNGPLCHTCFHNHLPTDKELTALENGEDWIFESMPYEA